MLKNIIFDFGGVLLNIDLKRSFDAFEALGYLNFEDLFAQHHADDLFQRLETSQIKVNEFYDKLALLAPNTVTHLQLQNAWNAMLINYRTRSIDFLKTLRKDYNIYLLSNTNEIHYNRFTQMLQEETGHKKLEDFFDKAWFSHLIYLRKPDVETFKFGLSDAGINAEETLFIDDSFSNLPAAESVGMKTHLLKPGELIEHLDYSNY